MSGAGSRENAGLERRTTGAMKMDSTERRGTLPVNPAWHSGHAFNLWSGADGASSRTPDSSLGCAGRTHTSSSLLIRSTAPTGSGQVSQPESPLSTF